MNLTPQQRTRFLDAALRALRVRRAALKLAGRASGHPLGRRDACRTCKRAWPCQPVWDQARELLDAIAELH